MSLVDRKGGSAKIKQFRFDIVCHACGTTNTIIHCSGCGRLNDAVHMYCYYCGLILENLDDIKKTLARDGIVLDYNHQPLVTETSSVFKYIAAMVRQVRERTERMGLGNEIGFVFKMSLRLWEDISNLYACPTPNGFVDPIWYEETREKQAKLKAQQSIFVDGVEYPVELAMDCGSDIFFMPQLDRESLPQRFLSAILRKVGKR